MKQILVLACTLLFSSCIGKKFTKTNFWDENISFVHAQIGNEIKAIEASGKVLNPVTINSNNSTFYCNYSDWRSGFFPGSVWYLYELTQDTSLLRLANKYTMAIEEAKNLTWHHDVGFIIQCSFGNGMRLTNSPIYKKVIVEAARSLSTRFRKVPGIIQSWDVSHGWQSKRDWQCPVIIDNLMNLELLFNATKLTGDSTFYKIAVSHANRTLAEQFRANGSCYHVVDYDLATGKVRHKHTAQGYSNESTWSRGQAWAIYGYTVCYRETGDRRYINQAIKTFNFMRNHKHLSKDLIPYWDMDAPTIPNEPRDVSTASCMASALYEISTMDVENASSYKDYADKLMSSLSSPAYRATLGGNKNFVLMHSVGSIPHNSEIDVPLNYADYYFIEALKRRKDLLNQRR